MKRSILLIIAASLLWVLVREYLLTRQALRARPSAPARPGGPI